MKNKYLFIKLILCLVIGLLQSGFAEFIESGFGKIKLNGLMQFWYQNDNAGTPKDTFRIRRAEIKLGGEIESGIVSWAVMIDPAQIREDTDRKSPLQDFIITLTPYKFCSIDFGQYKVPFGMEGLESSAKLDVIERSALATEFKWTDYRDIGFTIRGDFKVGNIKIHPAVGIFNGEGGNKLDVNSSKDFVGRLIVKPTEMIHLGIAHYNGKSDKTKLDNIRTGIEIKFENEPFTVYGEYAIGKSNEKNKQTYYLTLGYKITNSLQVVLRYDWYDPDIDTKDDEKHEDTIGLNYFIKEHNAKIQFNYIYRGEKPLTVDNNIVRINIQISY
jgi:phosphate-selective porin